MDKARTHLRKEVWKDLRILRARKKNGLSKLEIIARVTNVNYVIADYH